MNQEYRAPRFRAYLDRIKDALYMHRSDWEKLSLLDNHPVEIDISLTPLASLSKDAKIVGSFAEYTSGGKVTITIFRDDPKDTPMNINTDKYEVWEDIPSVIDIEETVNLCSTSIDSNLSSFLDDYVIIVPIEKGEDHHLSKIPARYITVLKNK